jgi:hypothetical protein
MTTNTQQQGRTLFSERDFTFTPKVGADTPWGPQVGDDSIRALNRWQIELQRQLDVGDVTRDVNAKTAALQAGEPVAGPAPTPTPPTPRQDDIVVTAAIPAQTQVVGDKMSFTPVTATGAGTLIYSINPELPNGVTLNSRTGQINGTAVSTLATKNYRVIVEDSAGASGNASFSLTITQTAPAPVADFTASPTSGAHPLTVTVTDTSTNSPTSWSWDFGDGSTATVQNLSHTYANAGTFTITHTATNAGGTGTVTKTGLITVS